MNQMEMENEETVTILFCDIKEAQVSHNSLLIYKVRVLPQKLFYTKDSIFNLHHTYMQQLIFHVPSMASE